MLARTPMEKAEEEMARTWSPTPAFLAEVEAIKADARARRAQLAADRASFWERATSDVQWDHDNERWNNGEGEV